MNYLVLALTGIVIIVLLYFMLKKPAGSTGSGPKNRDKGQKGTPCPLCKTVLFKGERVHSVVYPGKPDRMTHIFGCPFCFKDHPRSDLNAKKNFFPRICPVCSKVLGDGDYVVARMFERKKGIHVHVLGCTRCRER